MGEVSRALAGGRLEEAFSLLWDHCGSPSVAGKLLRALAETEPPRRALPPARLVALGEIERAALAFAAGNRELGYQIVLGQDVGRLAATAADVARRRTRELVTTKDCSFPGCRDDATQAADRCVTHLGAPLPTHEAPPPDAASLRRRRPAGMRAGSHALSRSELRALEYASRGYTTRRAAEAVGRAYATVQSQRKGAIRKLGAINMANAVAIAIRTGLIQPQ